MCLFKMIFIWMILIRGAVETLVYMKQIIVKRNGICFVVVVIKR